MCKLCNTKPVYEFTNQRKLCKNCFIKYFQKKVLYIIRKFKMIVNNDVVGYICGNDLRSVVLEDVLKMFAEKGTIRIVKLPAHSRSQIDKKLINNKKISKVAITSTIDIEADKIIYELIKGQVKDLKNVEPVVGKVIKPLYLFLDEEVLLYAKMRKLVPPNSRPRSSLDYTASLAKSLAHPEIKRKNKDKISKFIDELEEKHPEVKRAVVNSYLELY